MILENLKYDKYIFFFYLTIKQNNASARIRAV